MGGVDAEHTDLTACALPEAFQNLNRGRLSGAVGAEEGKDLAPTDLEIDAPYRLERAVAFTQPAHGNHRLPSGSGRSGGGSRSGHGRVPPIPLRWKKIFFGNKSSGRPPSPPAFPPPRLLSP